VASSITQRCHSRNPALDAGASGILLNTKKDSGQAGMSAPESVRSRRGESPLQVYALRPVTKHNCVTERWGGEQWEVKDQSVG